MEVKTQSLPQPTKVRVADVPFNDTSSDIILRSSGNGPTDFYTSKLFLIHASPVFAGMLSLPRSDQTETNNSPPVVTMQENAEDLRILLIWCTPGMAADFPSSVVQLYRYYLLADKYLLETTKVSLRQCLVPAFLHSAPAGVYTISRQLGWRKEAKMAIKETLSRPLHELVCEPSSIPTDISARFLQDLLKYHHEHSERIRSYMSTHYWIIEWFEFRDDLLKLFIQSETKETECCCATVQQDGHDFDDFFYTMVWWEDFVKGCLASLAQIPDVEKIPLGQLLCKASASTVKCQTCGPVALERLMTFLDRVKIILHNLSEEKMPLPSSN